MPDLSCVSKYACRLVVKHILRGVAQHSARVNSYLAAPALSMVNVHVYVLHQSILYAYSKEIKLSMVIQCRTHIRVLLGDKGVDWFLNISSNDFDGG